MRSQSHDSEGEYFTRIPIGSRPKFMGEARRSFVREVRKQLRYAEVNITRECERRLRQRARDEAVAGLS